MELVYIERIKEHTFKKDKSWSWNIFLHERDIFHKNLMKYIEGSWR